MYILTLPDNFDDLYQLPKEVVNRLRRTFQPAGIKIRLVDTPTKVCLMTYDNDTFVVASFLGEMIKITIVVNEKNKHLVDLRTGQRLEAYQQDGTVKHFTANNQEAGRRSSDSIISERALREIYLKGFEIAIKEGGAGSVMTTYGAVNGIWTAGSYDLCTTILREQWGFDGVV